MQSLIMDVLISAAQSPNFQADALLQKRYNEQRFMRAVKSLRTRNIFLTTEGAPTSTSLNNLNTLYTQPAGVRLLVLGYSDNFRYGAANTIPAAVNTPPVATNYPHMHRVRIVGPQGERIIVDDLVPAQAGISGQPRYTEPRFTVPIVIEANEQFAVDIGYDPTSSAYATLPPRAFAFFCLRVKEDLTANDQKVVDDLCYHINAYPFQRSVAIDCRKIDSLGVGITSASAAGLTVNAETLPANAPMLITGIGSNLQASKITILDTFDGTSFSLNRSMPSSAFNTPGYEDSQADVAPGAPIVAPLWKAYYTLPMPHLLVRGAQLKAEIVNGGDAGGGTNSIREKALTCQLVFAGVTV